MSRFFVFRGVFGRAINFYQNEARRIVLLLQNVEAGNAGFLNTVASVF